MSKILLYKTQNHEIKLEVLIQNETIWLNQKQISELFDVKIPAISKHLKNIFSSAELDEKVVVSKMEITTQHGAIEGKEQTKKVNFYNLDAIISIGYIVDSQKQNMGLTNWKNSPQGKIRKANVSIAKNYLEFDKYKNIQDEKYLSDFDNLILGLEKK